LLVAARARIEWVLCSKVPALRFFALKYLKFSGGLFATYTHTWEGKCFALCCVMSCFAGPLALTSLAQVFFFFLFFLDGLGWVVKLQEHDGYVLG